MPLISKARPKGARSELLALAEKLEPRIRQRFIDAVNRIKSDAKIKALADAIQSGDRRAIAEASGIQDVSLIADDMQEALQDAFKQAGTATGAGMRTSDGAAIRFSFDGYNKRAAEFMQRNRLAMVKDVVKTSLEAISAALQAGIIENKTPIQAARQIRDMIGLDGRRARALLNFRAMLERGEFGVAAARDVGGNAERTLRAASGGRVNLTQDRIESLVSNYRDRLLRSRAGTIASTETFKVMNQASREAFDQLAEQRGLSRASLRRFWVSTSDSHTRPDHVDLPLINAEGVGMDEPFNLPDGGTIMFPHDPDAPPEQTINCRCTVVYRLVDVPESALPPPVAGRSNLPIV